MVCQLLARDGQFISIHQLLVQSLLLLDYLPLGFIPLPKCHMEPERLLSAHHVDRWIARPSMHMGRR